MAYVTGGNVTAFVRDSSGNIRGMKVANWGDNGAPNTWTKVLDANPDRKKVIFACSFPDDGATKNISSNDAIYMLPATGGAGNPENGIKVLGIGLFSPSAGVTHVGGFQTYCELEWPGEVWINGTLGGMVGGNAFTVSEIF